MFRKACSLASRRGPHSFGLAWLDKDNKLKHKVMMRPFDENPGIIKAVSEAKAVIAHARLATFGSWSNVRNCQPFITGGMALAHNGNIYNTDAMVEEYKLRPTTEVDSEVFTLLVSKLGLDRAVRCLESSPNQAILYLDTKGEVRGFRRGHPLYRHSFLNGTYYCSFDMGKGVLL